MNFGYARVCNNEDGNLEKQREELLPYVDDGYRIINDAGKERNGYRLLKEHLLRKGDTLYVTSLDRLSRSIPELFKKCSDLIDMGVKIVPIHEDDDINEELVIWRRFYGRDE